MESKRENSVLIPYKVTNGKVSVFLQKRDKSAKILPNHFAFFGGKIEEEESPLQALEREIQEEMGFIPQEYEFLGKYNFTNWLANVYFLRVDENFEKEIKVMEGEYGKFFSETEFLNEPMLIDSDKSILKDLYKLLRKPKEL